MKVLLVATVQSHICQFHKPLCRVLRAHGAEIHVAAKDNLAEKNGLKLDFADRVFDLPFSRSPKSKDNLAAYKELKKLIDEGDYDVIHCNTPMGGIVARLASKKARRQGAKVYYTAHGFHFYKGAPKKAWLAFYPIEKFFARFLTDKVITITEEDFKLADKKFACPAYRIHGVGVDAERYHPVSEEERIALKTAHGFSPEDEIILCVGELLPNKNQATAIRMTAELVKTHPHAFLVLAGNGSEKDYMLTLAKRYEISDRVILPGYLTDLEVWQRMADVSVACSIREGLGLNVIEALLSGTPAVASDNRGHRELIKQGENGFLYPVSDDKEMLKYVSLLLSDKEMRKRISLSAPATVVPYTAAEVEKELEAIYFGEENG